LEGDRKERKETEMSRIPFNENLRGLIFNKNCDSETEYKDGIEEMICPTTVSGLSQNWYNHCRGARCPAQHDVKIARKMAKIYLELKNQPL
jgi:hypothetical protein